MTDWLEMFREARRIVRQLLPLDESLAQAFKFAKNNPGMCDEPEYWQQVKSHDFRPAFDTMVGWGKAGITQITPKEGWKFLLLDLGDCPDIFRLYRPGGQELVSEPKLRTLLTQELLIEAGAFEECFAPDTEDAFDLLFGNTQDIADHYVSELSDEVLNWTEGHDDTDYNFHGDNGYLLWLLLGSLALLSPFSDTDYCQRALQGREKLYLLSGYEEIFTYLATVTAAGLIYEEV